MQHVHSFHSVLMDLHLLPDCNKYIKSEDLPSMLLLAPFRGVQSSISHVSDGQVARLVAGALAQSPGC